MTRRYIIKAPKSSQLFIMNFPALPRKFFSHLVLASTIGLVLSTGTLAFTKVIQNFRSPKPEVLGETTDQTEQSVNQNQPAENLPTDSPANAPKSPPNTANILNSKLSAPKTATNLNSPSFALAPLPPPTSATNPQTGNNRCIVTLSGQQYDITSLLTTHSGGNVFTCNSDMTASYQQRHGTNTSMMQPYLVTGSTQPPGTITPTPPREDDDDD